MRLSAVAPYSLSGIRAVTVPTPAGGGLQLWLPEAGSVTVRLFDAVGSQVATLVDRPLGTGTHRIALPEQMAAGLYVVEMVQGEEVRRVRIVVE